MVQLKNKIIGTLLVGSLSIATLSGAIISNNDIKVVYAAESNALKNAKAKINHLTKSLKTNYLGIKNQAMWETYISQARNLIAKISNSESKQSDALTLEVNKNEALVYALARINQVEKSTSTNSKTIGNAETWNEYLRLAKIDLNDVDKNIFKKQYDELISRMNKVSLIVKNIEDKFQIQYDKVAKLFEEAKVPKDLNKAKSVLTEAEKLGACSRSNNLEFNIKRFIDGKNQVNFKTYKNYRFGFSLEYPENLIKGPEPTNGDGSKFTSDDFTILAYASNNVLGYNGYSYFESYIKDELAGEIIHQEISNNYVEVSYIVDGIVYYHKAVVGNSLNAIEITYLESKSTNYDDVLEYILNSFKTPNVFKIDAY